MAQLARLVRWWFGIQAILVALALAAGTAAFVWGIYLAASGAPRPALSAEAPSASGVERAIPALPYGIPSTRATSLAWGLILISSFLFSTVAWWALRKGWRSAQFWALSASLLSLADFGWGAFFGIAGLAVFWRKDMVAAMATAGATKSQERISGDGTSKFLDSAAQVLAMAAFFGASFFWADWASRHGLVRHGGMLGWAELGAAIFTSVLLHELGHFLAGVGMEMKLQAFLVGPVGGQMRGGRWKLALNPVGILGGGYVSMAPLHLRDLRGRFAYLAMAGPVFSLIAGMVALIGALTAPGSAWAGAWRFFALTGTMCLLDFVFNLIPVRPEGAYSDGARILQLVKGGRWAEEYSAFAMVASSLVSDLRPSQYDLALLERVAQFHQTGEKGAQVRLFIALHHVDSGRAEEAKTAWREAARLHPDASADGSAEYAFMEATVAQDVEKARAWWARVESKCGTKTASRREIDYWRGRAALLAAEGKRREAHEALEKADRFARLLPVVGAYAYDRSCLDMIRADERMSVPVSTQRFGDPGGSMSESLDLLRDKLVAS